MKVHLKILTGFALLMLLAFSCEKDNESITPKVESADDAQDVAYEICSALGDQLLSYRTTSKTWNNEVKSGYHTGSITLNGSYEYEYVSFIYSANKRYYRFNNVQMVLTNFCSDNDSDALTFDGTGKVYGEVIEKDGKPANIYSGGWNLSLNLELSGQFSDKVTMSINFGKDSFMKDFSGTLTNNQGESFSFSSRY